MLNAYYSLVHSSQPVSPSSGKAGSPRRRGSSVDEDSIVQGAQLVELSLDVGAELVEIRHVVFRGHAVSCNQRDAVMVCLALTHLISRERERAFLYTFTKLREGSFGNSTGAWHVAICFVICFVTRTRSRILSLYAAYAGPLPPKKVRNIILRLGMG